MGGSEDTHLSASTAAVHLGLTAHLPLPQSASSCALLQLLEAGAQQALLAPELVPAHHCLGKGSLAVCRGHLLLCGLEPCMLAGKAAPVGQAAGQLPLPDPRQALLHQLPACCTLQHLSAKGGLALSCPAQCLTEQAASAADASDQLGMQQSLQAARLWQRQAWSVPVVQLPSHTVPPGGKGAAHSQVAQPQDRALQTALEVRLRASVAAPSRQGSGQAAVLQLQDHLPQGCLLGGLPPGSLGPAREGFGLQAQRTGSSVQGLPV